MADHNEALRLADWLQSAVQTYPQMSEDEPGGYCTEVDQVMDQAAALLRQQAERIAELEARVHTCGPACSKAGCINRRLTTERDQLRAEVERLRVGAERWHVANLTAETAWKHPDHRSPEENTAFSAYRCAVEDGLNFEGAVDAAVAAIDHARTTHKDEG